MLIIGDKVPKFGLQGPPAREFSKTSNLVSIEDICRATGRITLKEILWANFEKNIVEKGSFLLTSGHFETGSQGRAPGYPS